jgi:hypothetical protein
MSEILKQQSPEAYKPLDNSERARNELLSAMGDEAAQSHLDVDHYFKVREEIGDEGADRADAESFQQNAPAYDEKFAKLDDLINELNTTRSAHREKMQVVNKNGSVVTRSKKVEADPTKTDDLFDTLAERLADSGATDDGLLVMLAQLDKKLNFTDKEVSDLIDKIANAREAKDLAEQQKAHDENSKKVENPFSKAPDPETIVKAEESPEKPADKIDPFASAPSASDRVVRAFLDKEGKPIADLSELNHIMATKVALGDESDWNNLVQTIRDQIKNVAGKTKDTDGNTIDVAEQLKAFEKHARQQYKLLKKNQNKDKGEITVYPPEPEEKGPIPIVINPLDHDAKKYERNKRWKKVGKAVGMIALAGLAAFGIKKGIDAIGDDRSGERPAVEQEIPVDSGNNENENPTLDPRTIEVVSGAGAENADSESEPTSSDNGEIDFSSIELSDWTWNVAHQLAPGQETQLIQQGIDAYNQANGTDFALQAKNGTTMIIDGSGRIVNQAQMEAINLHMIDAVD